LKDNLRPVPPQPYTFHKWCGTVTVVEIDIRRSKPKQQKTEKSLSQFRTSAKIAFG
jgi:hypothetical protein